MTGKAWPLAGGGQSCGKFSAVTRQRPRICLQAALQVSKLRNSRIVDIDGRELPHEHDTRATCYSGKLCNRALRVPEERRTDARIFWVCVRRLSGPLRPGPSTLHWPQLWWFGSTIRATVDFHVGDLGIFAAESGAGTKMQSTIENRDRKVTRWVAGERERRDGVPYAPPHLPAPLRQSGRHIAYCFEAGCPQPAIKGASRNIQLVVSLTSILDAAGHQPQSFCVREATWLGSIHGAGFKTLLYRTFSPM
jgi:hypothetical protein